MRTKRYWGLIDRILSLIIAAFLIPVCGSTQVVYGTITESGSQNPVEGAVLMFDDTTVTAITDQNGDFRFEGLGAGVHSIVVRHLQYTSVYREIQLSRAQDYRLDIVLERTFVKLPEATVISTRFTRENALYTITPEEITRFPGTFFDPARFALSFPGVQIVNDQANQLVINGMSPDLMKWRLEGLEVVNPNHLANAGTLSDRPSATGGGVQMLSNLVLENSELLTGMLPGYGNVTSGVMDMYFRNGNTSSPQHAAQVGLLGLEAMTEGPFKKGGKSSYLVNGRYSTVGLLSELGVDFGDEQIRFGDVSGNANFHIGEQTSIKVFGLFGANSNKFKAKEPDEWEEDKDRRNIDYNSQTLVAGFNFGHEIGQKGLLELRFAFSSNFYERQEEIVDSTGDAFAFSNDRGDHNKYSFDLRYNTPIVERFSLLTGFSVVVDDYDANWKLPTGDEYVNFGHAETWRLYANARGALTKRIFARIGLALATYSGIGTFRFEPEAEIKFVFTETQNLTLGYRLSSQTLDRYAFTMPLFTDPLFDNSQIEPIRSNNFHVTYQVVLGSGIFETTARYSILSNVPDDALQGDFSPLNMNPYPQPRILGRSSDGTGENVSLAFGYRKNFNKDWFITTNISFISSKYTGSDQVKRSTTYDIGYVGYLALGKEWPKEKEKGLRTWGLNGAVIANGGMKEPVIDTNASEENQLTTYEEGTFGQVDLDDYFRIDIRAYWRMDKENTSSTISLDVQNLLGRENTYFSNYDLLYHEVRPGTQLGLIPVLNWRLDF